MAPQSKEVFKKLKDGTLGKTQSQLKELPMAQVRTIGVAKINNNSISLQSIE